MFKKFLGGALITMSPKYEFDDEEDIIDEEEPEEDYEPDGEGYDEEESDEDELEE